MRYTVSLLFLLLVAFSMTAQKLTAEELLDKTINYHDPNSNWNTFNGNFKVTMTTPNQTPRASDISINLPAQFFSLTAVKDNNSQTYTIGKDNCFLFYNEKELSTAEAEEKKMTCERATMYKNYYSYLYGLPMKLKDKGTNLGPKVEKITFKDKDYLRLKVTYDAEVGSDIWYFYFDPSTYAMEVYQFFKTDKNGSLDQNSGEYILLSDQELVNGIKMPKIRAWYYNKNDAYLGTDTLGN